jgi:dissimilatory sulfite reductase (desulfoviridin) alpha/beta subunit
MADDTRYNLRALKSMGLMKQKEADLFSLRLRVVGGHLRADQLRALADLAEQYGQGYVHLTTRQGVELPDVDFPDVGPVHERLARVDLEFGACGRRVRTITACRGGSCLHGLIDPQELGRKIADLVADRAELPHKFKIGISGCPNGCTKPQENDLGIMGVACKVLHAERCNLCGLCVQACPAGEALSIGEDRVICDEALCLGCAGCVAACLSGAWEQTGSGYAVFVGGKMGKRPRLADRLPMVVEDEAELLALVDAVLDWYTTHGAEGERFGETLDRLGLEACGREVLRAKGGASTQPASPTAAGRS